MARSLSMFKRLIIGLPLRSDRDSSLSLSKRYAIPLLAVNPISSLAYAPEQIFLVLAVAGSAAYTFTIWIGLAVAVVMLSVIASYRYTVQAYPGGGGDYRVVRANFGPGAGYLAAAAQVLDYVLTVAVSTAAAVSNFAFIWPSIRDHRVLMCVLIIAALTAFNLRGWRVSGKLAAPLTLLFMVAIVGIIAVGFTRLAMGEQLEPPSAAYVSVGEAAHWSGAAIFVLAARAFATGSIAVSGVETYTNRVAFFRPPKGRNAAIALSIVGATTILLFVGLVYLAYLVGAQQSSDPHAQLTGIPEDFVQTTLIGQLASAVFFPYGWIADVSMFAIGGVLVLAANTAFVGFPRLASILASDSLLPRQLHKRGDRLVYSNGILVLAVTAAALTAIFSASSYRLMALYVVGVFLSIMLTNAAMNRHWSRILTVERDPRRRSRAKRARAIALVTTVMAGLILFVVTVGEFRRMSWIALVVIAANVALMWFISRHYGEVADELAVPVGKSRNPARNHAVVLVSHLNRPALRMIAYAQATRPDTLTALTVNVDNADTRNVVSDWEARRMKVPLTVLDSPYREITGPIIDYVKKLRRESPRDVVTVYLPEYVVGRWYERILHNQSAKKIRTRLRYEPGVMVTTVPWQLASSENRDLDRLDKDIRRRR
ncbi:APC family permease [Salininema proteolyticum]|uniref:APC family permease n=1 Tax=Salininema proteolyticum TaxID=1607685 RepID=A0ABV8U0K7_9ACTN